MITLSEIPDLCKAELAALAEVIEHWKNIHMALFRADLGPLTDAIDIQRQDTEEYLGWIGCNPDGDWVFQPATERPVQ